jgi:predicted ABC-type sugar transport system permease subunit
MRGLLILLTIGSAVWSVFATATYFAEADSPNVTIIQQIAVILMTGLSSISLRLLSGSGVVDRSSGSVGPLV